MKKNLMAVAVAGALAAPALAFAQGTSTVNIYGNVTLDWIKLDQGTQGTTGRVQKLDMISRYGSYLGFRGQEKLGGNLVAWFQCETTMDVTGEDESTWCDRNSGVGISGGWGNGFIGNWDTPHKIAHGGRYRPFSQAGIWGMRSLLFNEQNSTGGGDIDVAPASFDRRSWNSVNYHSPSWAGFNVKAQMTALDESTDHAIGVPIGPGGPFKPRLWSVSAEYDNGPLSIGLAYEQHNDFNPGIQATGPGATQYGGGEDKAWELSAAYTFAGVFRLSGIYSDLRYDVTNSTNLKHKGWVIYGDWAISGPHRLRLEYAQADDTKGNATVNVNSLAAPMAVVGGVLVNQGNTGAKLFGIQYGYSFSKRTEVVVGYAKLDNDANSRHRLQTSAARPTVGTDRDQDAWAVGIRHRF